MDPRDITFVMVSPAGQDKITTLKEPMGWGMPWYTCSATRSARGFGVAEKFD